MTAQVVNAPRSATFRAMGCPITITAVGAGEQPFAAALVAVQSLAEEWETRYSRFRSGSELSRLNARAGQGPVPVTPALFAMIAQAVAAVRTTDGLITPLVLPAVRVAGYDRDFAEIGQTPIHRVPASQPVPDISLVSLDAVASTVTLPDGCGLDLNAIAKGAFIDAVVERYAPQWPGGCVNAGGDLRVWGEPPSGDCWTIGIEYPRQPELDIVQVRLTDPDRAGAIATSGRNHRRWQTDRGPAHHLIDPATGSWAEGSIETASALAATAVAADLAAKMLFLSVSRQQPSLPGSASLGFTIDDRGAGTLWTTDGPLNAEIIPLIFRTGETR